MKKIIKELLLVSLLASGLLLILKGFEKPKIKDLAAHAVVGFNYYNPLIGRTMTYGSGFRLRYYDMLGFRWNIIVTNRHVCNVGIQIGTLSTAKLDDGFTYDILAIDNDFDICILSDSTSPEYQFELADDSVKRFDYVTLIGHPSGHNTTITHGYVTNMFEEVCIMYDKPLCKLSHRISALAHGGSSGSAVLNKELKVVGILFAGDSSRPHAPFIVPLRSLRYFLNKTLN